MKLLLTAVLALCVLLSACGSGEVVLGQEPGLAPPDVTTDVTEPPTTEPSNPDPGDPNPIADPGPMLVVSEHGGCYMAGPNCRTMSFWADGRVSVIVGEPDDRAEESSVIDATFTATWLDIATSTDLVALVERLPEGECRGCVDGIDLELQLTLDGQTSTLDSTTVEFVQSEPLFAATTELIEAIPYTLGEPPLSSDPAGWNDPIEPAVVIDGNPVAISAELAVVDSPGRALGFGLLDASVNIVGTDDEFVYVEIGRAAGCASFEHLAVVPTAAPGSYELFYDTDNTCEAFGISGYRILIADLDPDADGMVIILDTNGNVASVSLG